MLVQVDSLGILSAQENLIERRTDAQDHAGLKCVDTRYQIIGRTKNRCAGPKES